ncbi:MAG TPA: SRPBCC family protein, partial [Phenylobacterium sp.]|nr:SRPBCC family protein [Phenylobacterium sp.]
SPIIAIVVTIGAVFGRHEAARGRQARVQVFASAAVLPLLFAVEQLAPATTAFTVTERVFVAATPAQAWQGVVDVRRLPQRPGFPLNLGFAHPVSARWDGQGIGARRLTRFSTGMSLERATEWRPGRSLELEVLTQPPAMRELSPYGEVFAPHVRDYFRTRTARWDVSPAPGGSWVTVSTSHEMDLAPAPYWRPIAAWIVRANARRGLAHIRSQAEAALPSEAASRQGPPDGGDHQILAGL